MSIFFFMQSSFTTLLLYDGFVFILPFDVWTLMNSNIRTKSITRSNNKKRKS